jgi:hypothetical protein
MTRLRIVFSDVDISLPNFMSGGRTVSEGRGHTTVDYRRALVSQACRRSGTSTRKCHQCNINNSTRRALSKPKNVVSISLIYLDTPHCQTRLSAVRGIWTRGNPPRAIHDCRLSRQSHSFIDTTSDPARERIADYTGPRCYGALRHPKISMSPSAMLMDLVTDEGKSAYSSPPKSPPSSWPAS